MKNSKLHIITLALLFGFISISGAITSTALCHRWGIASNDNRALIITALCMVLPLVLFVVAVTQYGTYYLVDKAPALLASDCLAPGVYWAKFLGFYGNEGHFLFCLWPAKLECNLSTGELKGTWEPCPKAFIFSKGEVSRKLASTCTAADHATSVERCFMVWEEDNLGNGLLSFHPKMSEIDYADKNTSVKRLDPAAPSSGSGAVAAAS